MCNIVTSSFATLAFFAARCSGCLNNIISALGKNRNEISCVHLVKTYGVPSLLYGCEVWILSCAEYRHLNVVWNNTFR